VSKKAAPDTGDESEGSDDDADHSDEDENQHSQGDRVSCEKFDLIYNM
jgi:hypothetical protein